VARSGNARAGVHACGKRTCHGATDFPAPDGTRGSVALANGIAKASLTSPAPAPASLVPWPFPWDPASFINLAADDDDE
jgi:hypothetical protein